MHATWHNITFFLPFFWYQLFNIQIWSLFCGVLLDYYCCCSVCFYYASMTYQLPSAVSQPLRGQFAYFEFHCIIIPRVCGNPFLATPLPLPTLQLQSWEKCHKGFSRTENISSKGNCRLIRQHLQNKAFLLSVLFILIGWTRNMYSE